MILRPHIPAPVDTSPLGILLSRAQDFMAATTIGAAALDEAGEPTPATVLRDLHALLGILTGRQE